MCECGKGYVMPKSLSELTVDVWGPRYWKLLHIMATRTGIGDDTIDSDVANGFFYLLQLLPDVLPCKECKGHARTYILENRFKPQGLIGNHLRNYIMKWLLDFHNAVRLRKKQRININSIESYYALWQPQKFIKCDDEEMKLYFDYGRTYAIIIPANLTKWLNHLQRLRLALGV
jgi:hypothetical protein